MANDSSPPCDKCRNHDITSIIKDNYVFVNFRVPYYLSIFHFMATS